MPNLAAVSQYINFSQCWNMKGYHSSLTFPPTHVPTSYRPHRLLHPLQPGCCWLYSPTKFSSPLKSSSQSQTHRSLPGSPADAISLLHDLFPIIPCLFIQHTLKAFQFVCVPVMPAPGCVWTALCLFPSGSRGQAVCHLHHASRCRPDCLGITTQQTLMQI